MTSPWLIANTAKTEANIVDPEKIKVGDLMLVPSCAFYWVSYCLGDCVGVVTNAGGEKDDALCVIKNINDDKYFLAYKKKLQHITKAEAVLWKLEN